MRIPEDNLFFCLLDETRYTPLQWLWVVYIFSGAQWAVRGASDPLQQCGLMRILSHEVDAMAKFELMPLSTAQTQSATGKRAQIIREYLNYVEQLQAGQAGSLQAATGETLTAIRRRLTSAAKVAGKELVVRRAEDKVYFWLAPNRPARKRGKGRPRKSLSRAAL